MGLWGVKTIFQRYPDPSRPNKEILQLLKICVNNNDFLFDDRWFLQVEGTAMGHRYAPSYANLYMSEWEREALAKCPLKPLLYLRFLDDIIGIWPHSEDSFYQFTEILNNHHPSIKIKHTLDTHQVNFLDTTISLFPINATHKRLTSKVYFKPTDTHALLHRLSYHPGHTFKGIIKSQILRFHCICTHESDLHQAISILFRSLRRRNYSWRFLRRIKAETLAALSPTHSPLAPPHRLETLNRVHRWAGEDTPPLPGLELAPGAPPKLIPLVSTFSHKYISLKENCQKTQEQFDRLKNYRVILALSSLKFAFFLLVKATFTREDGTLGLHRERLKNMK